MDRILITNNPYYDNILHRKIKANPNTKIIKILYASQPLDLRNFKLNYGFDQYINLKYLYCAFSKENDFDYEVFIRPHPNESISDWEEVLIKQNLNQNQT